MEKSISEIKKAVFEACCALYVDDTCVGTGWVYQDSLIISAGHCFIDDGIEAIPEEINKKKIIGHFYHEIEGKRIEKKYNLRFLNGIYKSSPLIDYCVLSSSEPIFSKALPISTKDCWNGNFFSAGRGEVLNSLSSANGIIDGRNLEADGTTTIKLVSNNNHQSGFSGAPIYAEEVCGVIGIQSQRTINDTGAEGNTVLAYPIKYLIKDGVLNATPFIPRTSKQSDLDTAIQYRDKGDTCLNRHDFNAAKDHYTRARELLIHTIGEKGAYIDDINERIQQCESSRV